MMRVNAPSDERLLLDLFFPSSDIPGYYRLKRCLANFARIRSPIGSLLDAGCGSGAKSAYFAASRPDLRVVGADANPGALRMAETLREKLSLSNLTLVRADLVRETVPGGFDFIISSDVLEHIPEDRRYAANLEAMLNRGGHLYIDTPSRRHDHDFSRLGPAEQEDLRRWMRDIGHVRLGYTGEEIAALFPGCRMLSLKKTGNPCAKTAYFLWEKTILDPRRRASDRPPDPDYVVPLARRAEEMIRRYCVRKAPPSAPPPPAIDKRIFLQAVRAIDIGVEMEESGRLDRRDLLEEELSCLLEKP